MSTVDELLGGTTPTPTTAAGEPERDRYGRYLIDQGDGNKKAHTRATTVAKTLSDTFNLEQWGKRMTAKGLTIRPDLFARIAATPVENKQALNALVEEAQEAASASVGRNLGTALHSFTEQIDRGQTVQIPAPWDADVAAYRAEMVRAGVRIVPDMIERIVVLDELAVAGTFDRLITLRRFFRLPLVADLKTATEIYDWGQIAIQLALYAHADFIYDPDTGERVPMPEVDQTRALVMHLPPGKATCTLHLVDIEAGWEAVQHAMWTRGYRSRDRQIVTALAELEQAATAEDGSDLLGQLEASVEIASGGPAVPGELIAETNLVLRARLNAAVQAGAKNLTWPAGVPKFSEGGPATWAQVLQAETVVSDAEAEVGMPFLAALRADPMAPPAELRALSIAAPEDLVDREPPRPPIDDETMRLFKKQHDQLPTDLQAMALKQAVANGVPSDRRQWNVDHAPVVNSVLAKALALSIEREGHVAGLLADFDIEQRAALLRMVVVTDTEDLATTTGAQVELLEDLLDALDRGALCHRITDAGVHEIACVDAASETALLFAHSTKTAVLAAAKTEAATRGWPKPRSTAEVAADPLLVAVLTAERHTNPNSN